MGSRNSGAGTAHSRLRDSWGPHDEEAKTIACLERWVEQGWVWRLQKKEEEFGFCQVLGVTGQGDQNQAPN